MLARANTRRPRTCRRLYPAPSLLDSRPCRHAMLFWRIGRPIGNLPGGLHAGPVSTSSRARTERRSIGVVRNAVAQAQDASSAPAAPVSATASEGGIEEVIVSARRREESIQTTPVAVTAITTSQLDAAAVGNIGALQGAAPNLLITQQPLGCRGGERLHPRHRVRRCREELRSSGRDQRRRRLHRDVDGPVPRLLRYRCD